MLIASLLSLLLMTADGPATAAVAPVPAPPPVVAAPAIPVKPAVDPVITEVYALLAPYKGKSGDRLRGKLGFSAGTRPASDGEVVFWELKVEQEMTCGMDPRTLAMRCLRGEAYMCRLGIAFDRQGLVTAWFASGSPLACRGFVELLKAS